MYVDDTFGVGRSDYVRVARDRVVLVSEGVLAPGAAISTEKSVLASSADILGYHVDCLAVTIRPKDRAIDKLFYVLFSFSCSDRQLWQCLSSLVNIYILTCDPRDATFCGPHHSHDVSRFWPSYPASMRVCFSCVRY